MTALLAASLLLVSAPQTAERDRLLNPEPMSPMTDHQAIREVAEIAGFALYAPSEIARGFALRNIEVVKLPADSRFAGAKVRNAVRMTFINKTTADQFEMIQAPAIQATPLRQMEWIVNRGFFEVVREKNDTFVTLRRGTNDLAMLSGLITAPSARIVLERSILIRP
jgi:hypothetical protein